MYKTNDKHLTPYQQVEHEIREESNEERSPTDSPRRANDVTDQVAVQGKRNRQRKDAQPDAAPTDDDLAPEILIREDGARSPREAGDDIAADRTYRVVRRDEAGGTFGLDEAELARVDPLDGEPWNPEDEEG